MLFGPRLVGIIAHAQCGKLPDVNFSARKNTPRIMKYLNYLKIMHSNDFFSFKFDEYKLFAMLAKQNYSKIHLVTLKIEQEISFPHYARCYFVWGIVFLGCLINISMTYIKKNGKKCLFWIYSHLWNHFSQCGMESHMDLTCCRTVEYVLQRSYLQLQLYSHVFWVILNFWYICMIGTMLLWVWNDISNFFLYSNFQSSPFQPDTIPYFSYHWFPIGDTLWNSHLLLSHLK